MYENHELKPYIYTMTLKQARLKYRERYSMLKHCKLNFPSDPEFRRQGYRCSFCSAVSSQNHLRFCSRYEELRRGRNLEDEIEMIEYIADIMEMEDDASAEDDDVHEDGVLAIDK